MAKVKYVDNKPTLVGDDDDGKLRIFGKTLDEMRSNRRNTGETFPSKFTKKTLRQSSIDNLQPTTGNRVDFSDEKMGPNFKVPKKITKEKKTKINKSKKNVNINSQLNLNKNKKFIELSSKRMPKAIKAIKLIGNLSNRSNYFYLDSDTTKIFKQLKNSLKTLKKKFK